MSNVNPGNVCAGLVLERMDLKDPYREMYKAQYKLQERVKALPDPDRTLQESARKAIYWQFCIADECFELLEWINSPITETTDKEMKMEAIDILHFVFNLGIELEVDAERINAVFAFFDYKKHASLRATWNKEVALNVAVLKLQKSIVACIGAMPWKAWKTYSTLPPKAIVLAEVQEVYNQVLAETIGLCVLLGMIKEDIVDYYFAKNRENHARQNRGY